MATIIDSIQQKAYLGTEFLTWVWYRAEAGDDHFELEGPGAFDIEVDTAVALADDGDADVRQIALKGDAPGPSELMRRSVGDSKKIVRAKFRVVWQNVVWSCTVNAETLDVSGIKLPTAARGGGDIGEYLRLRLETMEGFLSVWEALYEYYLTLRLSEKAWAGETERLSEWLAGELR